MDTKDKIKFAFIIVIVVAIGCLAINQFFGFYYKAELLKNPCTLCKEHNPQYEVCFEEQSTTRSGVYGEWENKNKIKINLTLP